MKNKILSIIYILPLLITFMSTNPAAAQNDYFSWKIGTSQMDAENIKGIGDHALETLNKTTADDDVTAFSVAYGHRFTDNILPLRLEVELSFRSAFNYSTNDLFSSLPSSPPFPYVDTLSSDINSHTLFANLYIDLLHDSPIVPYVGGGIGIAWNIWENDASPWYDDSETTTGMAWNAGGGIALRLNRKLMLDVSYRYIDFGEAELSDLLKIEDLTANEIQLGLRLTF